MSDSDQLKKIAESAHKHHEARLSLMSSLLEPSKFPPVTIERYDAAFARRRLSRGVPRSVRTSLVLPVTMRVTSIHTNVPAYGMVYLIRDETLKGLKEQWSKKEAWQRFIGLNPRPSRTTIVDEKWFDMANLSPQRQWNQDRLWDWETFIPGGQIVLHLWYTGAGFRRRKKWDLVIAASGPAVSPIGENK